MITNADITLYSYDAVKKTYTKMYISKVFWSEGVQAEAGKTGLTDKDSVLVLIPKNSVRKKLAFTTGRDLIVKGRCSADLSFSTEKELSEAFRLLKIRHKVITVMGAYDKLYGGENLKHYKLIGK